MKPLTVIYWARFGLGILAAVLCILFNIFVEGGVDSWTVFLNGFSLALIIYLTSYYVFKYLYLQEVEKVTKIISTGIGVFFVSWIVFWALLWTLYRSGVFP